MSVSSLTTIGGNTHALQSALGALTHEQYTNARKLIGTGITSANPSIDKNTETFIGQLRWYKPLNPTINVASVSDSADGSLTNYAQDYLNYVKTVRTHGARRINVAQLVQQTDGLMKVARDFSETRAQDEHNALMSVLKGVAISELLYGAASASGAAGLGGQTFDNDPTDKKYGFYVDLGASKAIIDPSTTHQGAARAQGFLNALGMAFKDYEPDYAYLVTSPEMMASLRSANLVDQVRITDGNMEFETIFNGKFRLIQTRASQSLTSTQISKINLGSGVDLVGAKTSYIVLPGSVAAEMLNVPEPVEYERDGAAHKGSGTTTLWYRWGYVMHPAGYSWNGFQSDFPSDAQFMQVLNGAGAPVDLTSLALAADVDDATPAWSRKSASALSLGVLPIFHS